MVPRKKCNCSMLICECLATLCHIDDLRPRGGAVSARSPKKYRRVRMANIARHSHATSTATLKFFKSRDAHVR